MKTLPLIFTSIIVSATAYAAPVITTLNPTNNAEMVRPSMWFEASFDRPVSQINGGVITIYNITDSTTETTITIPSQEIRVTNSMIRIRPEQTLAMDTVYAIRIDGDSVEDLGGTNFPGILDNSTWRFKTSDDPNWSLVAYWPLTNSTVGPISSGAKLDDVIDSPYGDEVDATINNSSSSYTNDAERGMVVWRTPELSRSDAGRTQMNRNFTWQCWVKTVANDNGTMMGTRDGSYARFFPNNMAADGYGISWTFNGTYNDNQWYHFVLTRNVDTFAVYVNGVLDSQRTFDRGDNNMRLEIGGSSRYNEDINAFMSEVAVWDETLSLDRIQELAAGGPVILPPPGGTVITLQ